MIEKIILILLAFFPLYLFGQDSKPEFGKASYYSDVFQNRKTANGERYNKDSLTAAHLKYPFGTHIRVTNLQNNKSVVVRINDRGPVKRTRILDLSKAAAKELDMMKAGVAPVKVEVISSPEKEDEEKKGLIAEVNKEKAFTSANEERAKNTGNNFYSIQVAVLRKISNLEKLKKDLKEHGYNNPTVLTEQKEELTLYKVSLGPYTSETEAMEGLKKLKSQNFDGFIVKQ